MLMPEPLHQRYGARAHVGRRHVSHGLDASRHVCHTRMVNYAIRPTVVNEWLVALIIATVTGYRAAIVGHIQSERCQVATLLFISIVGQNVVRSIIVTIIAVDWRCHIAEFMLALLGYDDAIVAAAHMTAVVIEYHISSVGRLRATRIPYAGKEYSGG